MQRARDAMETNGRRGPDRLPLLVLVLALAVYLPGITWGIPDATGPDRTHAWGNDDQVPLAPLAEMHNTFVVEKPDRNIAYPWFHYFLLACAYAPYLLYLLATGGLARPAPFYPFGFADPVSAFRHLSWIGRSVTLCLGLATALGAYHAARHLWGRTAGFVAAVFTLLMFPMAYYARLGNPDVPSLGWTSLALAVAAQALRQGLTVSRGAWFGLFAALAIATKTPLGSFALLAPALLWRHFRAGTTQRLWGWTSVWAAPVATAASFVVVYVAASGIPVDPSRYVRHVAKAFDVVTTSRLYLRHPATLAGYTAHVGDMLASLVDVMSWPVLAAAAVGLVLAVRADRPALPLALSSLGFFLMVVPARISRLHYLLPVALPLNLFAGYAVARGLAAGQRARLPVAVAATAAMAYLLLQTVDLTHDMRFDSRYAAGAWLDRHLRPGDRLVYFTPGQALPRLRADVESVRVSQRARALPTIEGERPAFILVMPYDINEERHRVEWRRGPHSVYSDYLPADVYERLVIGGLGYRLVARFQTPRLFPWLARPFLPYSTVNPPVHIFVREDRADGAPALSPWPTAPHYPRVVRSLGPAVGCGTGAEAMPDRAGAARESPPC